MNRRILTVSLTLIFLAAPSVFAQEGPPAPPQLPPFAGNVFNLTQQQPLPYDQEIAKQLLSQSATATSTLLQIRTGVKAHYHAYHDELVYVVSGKGVMEIGDEKKVIKAGDVVSLQRGTIHSLNVKSAQPMIAISIISPPFDGRDRVYTQSGEDE